MIRKLAILLALLVLAGCGSREGGLRVRRGTFAARVLLTGELRAVRAVEILVPRLPMWRTQIRWMERDGTPVQKGQKVLELDLTSAAGDLEDKRLAAMKASNDLKKQEAVNRTGLEGARLALEQRRAEMEKAQIQASAPAEVLARRDYEARQLALARAETAYAKARSTLEAAEEAAKADLAVARLAMEKAARDLDQSQEAMSKMTVLAPCDGVLDVASHQWEPRKLRVGDMVFVGWTVLRIPDLSQVEVAARLFDVDEGKVRPGMKAVCRMDTFPDTPLPGRVKEVSPVAQEVPGSPARRAFDVVISLDRSEPERMRAGMSVKVEVEAARISNALLAPRAALDLSGPKAMARLRGGKAVGVTLGPCNAAECVVVTGLDEGQGLAPWGSGP